MSKPRRDALSALFGLVVFLVGVGLIFFAFKLAYDMFTVPPTLAMDIKPGAPVALDKAANGLYQVVVKVVVLVIMAGIGSAAANKGIKLYAAEHGRIHKPPPD